MSAGEFRTVCRLENRRYGRLENLRYDGRLENLRYDNALRKRIAASPDGFWEVNMAEGLAALEGRPWLEFGKARKPISANQLANQLRRFGVTPRTIRLATGNTAKGYHRDDFKEAFDRFLPPPHFQTVTP